MSSINSTCMSFSLIVFLSTFKWMLITLTPEQRPRKADVTHTAVVPDSDSSKCAHNWQPMVNWHTQLNSILIMRALRWVKFRNHYTNWGQTFIARFIVLEGLSKTKPLARNCFIGFNMLMFALKSYWILWKYVHISPPNPKETMPVLGPRRQLWQSFQLFNFQCNPLRYLS